MKTVKFDRITSIEEIPSRDYEFEVTAYEFKGDCTMLLFTNSKLNLYKWCDSLESAKEFYNKWKELRG